jgi:hypothetical protein
MLITKRENVRPHACASVAFGAQAEISERVALGAWRLILYSGEPNATKCWRHRLRGAGKGRAP